MEVVRHAHQVKRWRLALNYVLRIFGLSLTQHVLIYTKSEEYLELIGVTTGNVLLDSLPTYHIVCDMEQRQDIDEETLRYIVVTQMAYCAYQSKLPGLVLNLAWAVVSFLIFWLALYIPIHRVIVTGFKMMTSYVTTAEIVNLLACMLCILAILQLLSVHKRSGLLTAALIRLGNLVHEDMSKGPMAKWLEQSIRELRERKK